MAFGKSHHAGQTGTITADYGEMLLIKADDPSYPKAFKSSGREGKYFQSDSLQVRQTK